MRPTCRVLSGPAVLAVALHPVCAEPQACILTGTAGGAGLAGEVQPLVAASLTYTHPDALGRGHIFTAAAGIGYLGLVDAVPTPIELVMAQAVAAPIAREYSEIENGRKTELEMDAPLYGADLWFTPPTDPLRVEVDSRLIVGQRVSNAPNDKEQLFPAFDSIAEEVGVVTEVLQLFVFKVGRIVGLWCERPSLCENQSTSWLRNRPAEVLCPVDPLPYHDFGVVDRLLVCRTVCHASG